VRGRIQSEHTHHIDTAVRGYTQSEVHQTSLKRIHRRELTTKLIVWNEVDGISHQVYCFSRRVELLRVNLRTSAECHTNHAYYE
jgi:hypothetical protein